MKARTLIENLPLAERARQDLLANVNFHPFLDNMLRQNLTTDYVDGEMIVSVECTPDFDYMDMEIILTKLIADAPGWKVQPPFSPEHQGDGLVQAIIWTESSIDYEEV